MPIRDIDLYRCYSVNGRMRVVMGHAICRVAKSQRPKREIHSIDIEFRVRIE